MLVPTGATTQEFNGLITISETAKLIWENMDKVDCFEDLVKMILDEYEIDEETAIRDAHGFISELLRAGFITFSKEDQTW